jgi:murein DD-endopeptidase MepM/ murein hydrolase activator NlpD
VVKGQLSSSLEEAIERSGAPVLLAYAMADVLQWDLDFNRDLRVGDRFEILFEEVWVDGAYQAVGGIVALSYDNRGRTFEAYRFGEDGGYYDGDGRPLKKMFLRSPLRFSRITSRFSHRRFHPVLKTYRPHWGVDYGAPVGTPVHATANGTVSFAGWDGGGGKTVKIRHPGGILTAYLHLSRFAAGIRPGSLIRQGEVVGYVGATGLATGPHLDYRVNRDGRWIDPLSLGSVPARPLEAAEMAAFRAWRTAQRASLEAGAPLTVAPEAAALPVVATVPPIQGPAALAGARR